MIKPSLVDAQAILPALTYGQQLNLIMVVKAIFPSTVSTYITALTDAIVAERATPTEKTQILKSILAQVEELPEQVVESEGSVDEPSFFSTPSNWKALAIDILNILEVFVPVGSEQSWAIVQRPVEGATLVEDIYAPLKRSKMGRRY